MHAVGYVGSLVGMLVFSWNLAGEPVGFLNARDQINRSQVMSR